MSNTLSMKSAAEQSGSSRSFAHAPFACGSGLTLSNKLTALRLRSLTRSKQDEICLIPSGDGLDLFRFRFSLVWGVYE